MFYRERERESIMIYIYIYIYIYMLVSGVVIRHAARHSCFELV